MTQKCEHSLLCHDFWRVFNITGMGVIRNNMGCMALCKNSGVKEVGRREQTEELSEENTHILFVAERPALFIDKYFIIFLGLTIVLFFIICQIFKPIRIDNPKITNVLQVGTTGLPDSKRQRIRQKCLGSPRFLKWRYPKMDGL